MSTDPLDIGLSALEAYGLGVDVAANNLANVGTAGFQGQNVEFQEIFNGAVAARISTNPASGGFLATGSGTDVAIQGAGFFVLAGPNNSTIYTRAGNFSVAANGNLVDTSTGYTVTSANGGPIAIPNGTTAVRIQADGTVSGTLASGQIGTFGRVALAAFPNPGGLLRAGGGYQTSANSGNVLLGAPGTAGYGSLAGGFIEDSNVDMAGEIIKMTASQKAYEANAKAVRTNDQIQSVAISLGDEGRTA